MDIARTGVIVNTENYEECVAFYRDVFALKVLFEEITGDYSLTCFDFGGSYLMIEMYGKAKPEGKTIAECPMKLRFNVPDIHVALRRIKAHGLDARIETFPWGSRIDLHDPDGNRIGIRDEVNFVRQFGG